MTDLKEGYYHLYRKGTAEPILTLLVGDTFWNLRGQPLNKDTFSDLKQYRFVPVTITEQEGA